jgi:predicted amino acid dehydrogenase
MTTTPNSAKRSYAGERRRPAQVRSIDKDRPKNKFAFLLHYTTEKDIIDSDQSFEQFTDEEFGRWREWARALEPGVVHHMDGIVSLAEHCAEGWIIAIPMLPRDMLALGQREGLAVLENAMRIASERGASILGLGGFTSIVSRGGEALTGKGMWITSGNTLTTVMAVAGIEEVSSRAGLDLARARTAIVGATGAIGRLASLLLAGRVGSLTLVGNPSNPDALARCVSIAGEIYCALLAESGDMSASSMDGDSMGHLAQSVRSGVAALLGAPDSLAGCSTLARTLQALLKQGEDTDHVRLARVVEAALFRVQAPPPISCTTDLQTALLQADLVLTATNSELAHIRAHHLSEGTIVCDVARPPNVAPDVMQERNVLVFDGGLVRMPEPVGLGPVRGLPPGVAWGCLAETILLALEGEASDHSIGQKLTSTEANHLGRLAKKHGLRPAPFHRYGRRITEAELDEFKKRRLGR